MRAVVPYPPGGGTDIIARQIAARLYDRWGHALVNYNRAGGGSVIGTEVVARAPADGYTLLITTGTHAVNATLIAKLPFDPIRSFEPVALLGTAANVLLVHPLIPAKNVSAFAAAAKARPGAINIHRVAMVAPAISLWKCSNHFNSHRLPIRIGNDNADRMTVMERILDRLLLQAVSRLLTKAQKRP